MDPDEIIINQALEEQADMTAVEQFAFKKDFCQLPKEASHYKESPIYAPERVGEVKHTHLSIDLAGKLLGWKPEYSLTRGIQETVASLKA